MIGRNIFSIDDINAIRKLIAEKVTALPDKQKGIRAKIRKIGFYYSDYEEDKPGYTVGDFERILKSGRIKIKNAIQNDSKNETLPDRPMVDKALKKMELVVPSEEIDSQLANFLLNRFHPKEHDESKIERGPGNYIICLCKETLLPDIGIKPIFSIFEGLQVLYTGVSSKSLRTRDYKQHFKGNNSGRSTLRKSLGVFFGYKRIPRDNNPESGKTKYRAKDEIQLTEWMHENLIMFFFPTGNFEKLEGQIISILNPPLNLKGNTNPINKEFRALLHQLRNID